ncbi:Ion transport 2 domain protein [Clostridium sp. DL-VIII]|uniref:potassium channel family protein n=1 Tax=Clostridium sp. DL-VIII TaxID=641107 RepID=UPI00023B071F|nr:potassium channel family protein [Clostridium sp. DL-VIII]EHJ02112.1 Ion transport 2 domain protein [Clostridium sp. DL-VIII]
MGDIIIFCMTIVSIIYLYYILFKNRIFLSHYLTSTGGNKPKIYNVKFCMVFIFMLIHFIIGIAVGIFVFINENDKGDLIRIFVAVSASLFIILLLWVIYFVVIIGFKEIIAMSDKVLNMILINSIVTFSILFYQIYNEQVEYPEAFIGASIVLYVINIISIARIVTVILKKKVSVKSIWCISIINISFAIVSLTNITFKLQSIYGSDCYSRELISWGDALYFVVITFFTVGYGDLYPVCEVSKILSMVTIITGFIFSTIFVSAGLSVTIEHFANVNKKE